MPGGWGTYSWGTETWGWPVRQTPLLSLSHDVTVSDIFSSRLRNTLIELVDNVTVDDIFLVRPQLYLMELIDDIVVTDRFNLVFTNAIEHDVNFSDSLTGQRIIIRTLSDILSINSDFSRLPIFEIKTIPDLISIFPRNVIYTRTLIDLLDINSTFDSILLITEPGPHPIGSGVQVARTNLVILETSISSIILPIPELNDSLKNNDQITLKRSMAGSLFAYVKKGNTQTFSYTWLLDFTKAAEFKAWLVKNMGQKITIINWKGEKWVCNIISDVASFRAETKYQGKARQKTSITIEFEGTRVI
jgi:hypothetical protein